MGSCMCKEPPHGHTRSGTGTVLEDMVKILTSTGGLMELYAPITAACVTHEFPGHALFRTTHPLSPPLPGDHRLRPGEHYYLLPLPHHRTKSSKSAAESCNGSSSSSMRVPLVRKASEAAAAAAAAAPPRCSSAAGEVWKVRLVISPDELSEILAHDARTQALIDSVRAVAKCSAVATPIVDHRLHTPGPAAY